jgi:predicted NBD/HSP70 family sugar kinase/ribosomal protein S25
VLTPVGLRKQRRNSFKRGRTRTIAEQWLRTILGTLREQSTITRTEILGRTGLNGASACHALQHLIRAGIVFKAGELQSKTGRRREILRLNPEAAYLVAVDLEASPIRFALTNLLGDIVCRWEENVDLREPLELAKIANGVEMVCRNLARPQRERVLAVGMSRPGVQDSHGRVTALNLGWREFPLEENLISVLTLPCFVQNSAQSFIMAERSHGRAHNCENCIYIEVGKGVGAGVVANNLFLGGHTQVEFGHITIDPGASDLCRCGKRGCLEAIASGPNIIRQYLERTAASGIPPAPMQLGDVFDRARRHDPDAIHVVNRVARLLGIGISHLVAMFSPELIILGGYLVRAEDLFMPGLREELSLQVCEWMGHCEIAISALGIDIGLKGAASAAFYGILNDPRLLRTMCRLENSAATVSC